MCPINNITIQVCASPGVYRIKVSLLGAWVVIIELCAMDDTRINPYATGG